MDMDYFRTAMITYDGFIASLRSDQQDLALAAMRGKRTPWGSVAQRSEEHTSELQSLMRSSYAVFCLKTKTQQPRSHQHMCAIRRHPSEHDQHTQQPKLSEHT